MGADVTAFIPRAFVKMSGPMERKITTNFGVALLVSSGVSVRSGEHYHTIQFRSPCCHSYMGRAVSMRPLSCDKCSREVPEPFVTPDLLKATHYLDGGVFLFNEEYAEACEIMASTSSLDPIQRVLAIAALERAMGTMLRCQEEDPQAVSYGELPLQGVMA